MIDAKPASLTATNAPMALEALRVLDAGVIVCDVAGVIVLANPSAEAVLGQGPLGGRTLASVLAAPDDLRRQARDEGARPTLRVEGRSIGYQVSETAAGELVVLFRDISAQLQLQAERDRLLQLSTVGDILPAVLHELRNPLAAVTLALEVLLDTGDTESEAERIKGLQSVLNELRRMGLIFQGIGAVGRQLRGSRPAPLDQAVREVVRVIRHRSRREGVTLICDVEPLQRRIDPAVFKAIVFNLITNALQACERSGWVEVRLHAGDDGGFVLRVTDDGRGMTPEELAECVRPFFTTRANGSGLGLLICKEAVEDAGGTLTLTSAPGEGTVATVHVPESSPS